MSRLKKSRVISKSDSYNNSCSHASSAETVFGVAELREKILMYAIHDIKVKLSGETVKNVRLVQRSWLQTTNKLLQKIREPVIEITVDGNGFIEDAKKKKAKQKRLNQLVETFGASPRLLDSFLPVKLDFKLDFFRERNYETLTDCLTRFGNYLVELQLEYPKSRGSMPGIFPPFILPHLRKLSFQFSDKELEATIDDDNEDVFGDNRNGLVLLQLILNASKDVRNLILPFVQSYVLPVGFRHLRLPPSISFLEMSSELKSKDLEVLLRNQLPKLSYFKLQLYTIPFEDGVLFKILERFQKTLQTLEIDGLRSSGHPRPPAPLRFPLMKELNKIHINCTECELDVGNVSALQKCLPKLTAVELLCQTDARLTKWTQNSKFESVEKLCAVVVNEQLYDSHESYVISPGFQILTQLHHSFPNIWHVALAFNVNDLASLQCLFQQMIRLKLLKISFFGNDAVLESSSDLIDSTFLGLPLWMVQGLKNDKKLLESGAIAIEGGSEPSLRNLSELTWLSLRLGRDPEEGEPRRSLVSDLLFRHAFMKMPKLRILKLTKEFKLNSEMEKEWKGQGRFVEYSDT